MLSDLVKFSLWTLYIDVGHKTRFNNAKIDFCKNFPMSLSLYWIRIKKEMKSRYRFHKKVEVPLSFDLGLVLPSIFAEDI